MPITMCSGMTLGAHLSFPTQTSSRLRCTLFFMEICFLASLIASMSNMLPGSNPQPFSLRFPGDTSWSHLRKGLLIPRSPQLLFSMFAAGCKPGHPAPSPSPKPYQTAVPLGIVLSWRWNYFVLHRCLSRLSPGCHTEFGGPRNGPSYSQSLEMSHRDLQMI